MPMPKSGDSTSRSIDRRTFLKGAGVASGVAVTGGAGVTLDAGPVGSSEAIAPAVALGVAAAGAGVGWALRAVSPDGSDAPPEGLTPGGLKQQATETALTRKSTNASTFADNRNIIQSGLKNTLYTKGKVAAIEALNSGATESEVQTAAIDAYEDHLTTVKTNLYKSWNESVNELESLFTRASEHPDLTLRDITKQGSGWHQSGMADSMQDPHFPDTTTTLPDGSDFTVRQISITLENNQYSATNVWSPLGSSQSGGISDELQNPDSWGVIVTDGTDDVNYLRYDKWGPVVSDIEAVGTDVNNGLITWVSNVYGEVQSGAIEISELTTPRMRANSLAEENGGEANAIADLQALNIPVSAGQETTLTLTNRSITLTGTLALTGDVQIQPGETYDPNSGTWSGGVAYFTYDESEASGEWSDFEAGVDGGVISFMSEPFEGVIYRVNTTANETAEIPAGDFVPVDSSGNEVDPATTDPASWQFDASEQLATPITEVSSVEFASQTTEMKMSTIQLSQPFAVESITQDGEEQQEATFETTEAQTDSNYITQEEWNQLEQQNKELIEKYEASKNSGGGSLIPDLGFGPQAGTLVGGVVVVGGVFAGLVGLSNN